MRESSSCSSNPFDVVIFVKDSRIVSCNSNARMFDFQRLTDLIGWDVGELSKEIPRRIERANTKPQFFEVEFRRGSSIAWLQLSKKRVNKLMLPTRDNITTTD